MSNELKVYHCNEWHNEYTEFYLKHEADKVLAEKDKDITILQQSLQSAESVSSYRKRTIKECEAKIDRMRTDISEKDTYISNLKNDIAEKDAQILDLIEQVQKERSAKVDYKISANDLSDGLKKAYEKIRRLERSLWLARAESAKNASFRYHRLAQKEVCDPQPHGWSCYITGEVYPTGKMRRKLEPHYWCDIWDEVERKCRAKAEQYK